MTGPSRRPLFACPFGHRPHARLALDGEHAARLVDDGQRSVLPHNARLWRAYPEQGVGLDVETLQHVREYGLAFADACRIEFPVAAHFAAGDAPHQNSAMATGLSALR